MSNPVAKSVIKEVVVKNKTVFKTDFRPMLLGKIPLDDYNDKNKSLAKKLPFIGQFKYDGIRCCIVKDFNVEDTRMFSRHGAELHHSEILKDVISLLQEFDYVNHLDGELYIHGKTLHQISSVVKGNGDKSDLKYVIYDVPMDDMVMLKRRSLMHAMEEWCNDNNITTIVFDKGVLIETAEEAIDFYGTAIDAGYEGAVMTRAMSNYKVNKRSVDKLKMKPFDTREFLCVGHYYGEGKCTNMSTLWCATDNAVTNGWANSATFENLQRTKPKSFIDKYFFGVKMLGTDAEREEMAVNFDTDFKDKLVTVRYRFMSEEGKPCETAGIAVRDYE